MKFTQRFFGLFVVLMLSACGSLTKSSSPSLSDHVDTQLKVSTGGGRVKAKLALTNRSSREILIHDLGAHGFKVETVDGQALSFKGDQTPKPSSLRLKPGQTVETAFNLQQSFPFKDRLTRYKIRFENSELRSNDTQVWY